MVICRERGADLHMSQLMPLPLIVSCFSKIQIAFFLAPAHLSSPGQRAVKRVCVCVCVHTDIDKYLFMISMYMSPGWYSGLFASKLQQSIHHVILQRHIHTSLSTKVLYFTTSSS